MEEDCSLNFDFLLPSLVYANNSIPFYQKWDGANFKDLYNNLPYISKADFIEKRVLFQNNKLKTKKTLYSTGSISGIKTPVHKSIQEEAFINKLVGNNCDKQDYLNVYLKYNPSGDFLIENNSTIVIPILETFLDFEKIITNIRRHSEGKYVRLFGLESQIRVLKEALTINKSLFRIDELIVGGDILTSKLKSDYEKFFQTNVVNKYGITEIFGGATKQGKCELFHPDEYLSYEIQSVDYRTPNSGELVLNSIYPYNQKTFLLKYKTGDIVREDYCQVCKKRGFELIGRKPQVLCVNGLIIFSPIELYNKLNNFEIIDNSSLFQNNKYGINPKLLGHLRFYYTLEENTIHLHLVVKTSVSNLLDNIRNEILNEITPLILVNGYKFEIHFYNPTSKISSFLPDEIEI